MAKFHGFRAVSTIRHESSIRRRRRCSIVEPIHHEEGSQPAVLNMNESPEVALPIPTQVDTIVVTEELSGKEVHGADSDKDKRRVRLGCAVPLPLPAPEDRNGEQEVTDDCNDKQLRQASASREETTAEIMPLKSQVGILHDALAEANARAQHLQAKTKDGGGQVPTAGDGLEKQAGGNGSGQERDEFEKEKRTLLKAYSGLEKQLQASRDQAQAAAETQRELQSKLVEAADAHGKMKEEILELRAELEEAKEQRKAGLEERRVLQNVLREREKEATSVGAQLKVIYCMPCVTRLHLAGAYSGLRLVCNLQHWRLISSLCAGLQLASCLSSVLSTCR